MCDRAGALDAREVAGGPIFVNGTFDTDLSGWTLGGGCELPIWASGTAKLNDCDLGTSDPTVSQTLSGFSVGHTYDLEFDVQGDRGGVNRGTGKSFGVFLNADATTPLFLGEYESCCMVPVTVSFVADSADMTFVFAGELDARTPGGPGVSTGVAYFLDNVSIVDPGLCRAGVGPDRAQARL